MKRHDGRKVATHGNGMLGKWQDDGRKMAKRIVEGRKQEEVRQLAGSYVVTSDRVG